MNSHKKIMHFRPLHSHTADIFNMTVNPKIKKKTIDIDSRTSIGKLIQMFNGHFTYRFQIWETYWMKISKHKIETKWKWPYRNVTLEKSDIFIVKIALLANMWTAFIVKFHMRCKRSWHTIVHSTFIANLQL